MSTTETDEHVPAEADSCDKCGSALSGGRFCSECGHPVAAANGNGHVAASHGAPVDAPTLEAPVAPRPSAGADAVTRIHTPVASAPAGVAPRRRRTPLIAGVASAVALIVVGVVAALLLTSNDDSSANTAFQQRVASVFGPVLGANNDLSRELARIHGANPTDSRAAVSRAQQATTAATGALGALNVPAGSEQLIRDGRQVLDRETAYLSALSAVLANQSSASRSQLETLSSNLASAFSAAGPTVAGTSPTVSGADVLTAWAQRTARVLKKRARAKAARRRARAGQTGGTAAAPPATNPYHNGRDCGGGVYAGPNTSCEFAFNVRSAYLEAPGLTASVSAFSPATGQTYTMDCSPSGSGTTCSGANNASVTF